MAHFRNICLIEAPQAIVTPFPRFITDCIGVCYLAGAVQDIAESLVIPDNYYNDGLFESFRSLMKKRPIDLVAISSMTGGFNNAVRLARIAREHGAFVVMGGFHPTALPEEVLKFDCVDLVVIGEGEHTFRELVQNGPDRNVKGLAWQENGGIVYTGKRDLIDNMDSIAFPLRTLRPSRFGEKGLDYTIDTIYTSRGCPWSCSFCANDKMHQRWRGRSPENVVEEIALLHDPKKKKLLKIWDANFLTNIKRAEAICDLMIDRGLTNFRIMTETRAKDVVRAERILGKLNSVGLKKVGLGIESPNPETLAKMNKQNSLEDVSKAIGLLQKFGVGAEGYFIIGNQTDTVEDTMTYPAFAKSLGLKQALFMAMTPYPGTRIFEEYRSEDNITSYDWDLYNNFSPVVRTSGMDTSVLVKMMAYCNVAFCSYRSMLKRENERGVLIVFLQDLFQLAFLMRVNSSLDKSEIGDAMFEAFLRFNDTNPHIEWPCESSTVRLKDPMIVGVERLSGDRIEFVVEQEGDRRVMSLKRCRAADPYRGPVVQLEKLIDAACSFSMDTLMRLLYRNELIRNNPSAIAGQVLGTISDGEIRRAALTLVLLYRSCFSKKRS